MPTLDLNPSLIVMLSKSTIMSMFFTIVIFCPFSNIGLPLRKVRKKLPPPLLLKTNLQCHHRVEMKQMVNFLKVLLMRKRKPIRIRLQRQHPPPGLKNPKWSLALLQNPSQTSKDFDLQLKNIVHICIFSSIRSQGSGVLGDVYCLVW